VLNFVQYGACLYLSVQNVYGAQFFLDTLYNITVQKIAWMSALKTRKRAMKLLLCDSCRPKLSQSGRPNLTVTKHSRYGRYLPRFTLHAVLRSCYTVADVLAARLVEHSSRAHRTAGSSCRVHALFVEAGRRRLEATAAAGDRRRLLQLVPAGPDWRGAGRGGAAGSRRRAPLRRGHGRLQGGARVRVPRPAMSARPRQRRLGGDRRRARHRVGGGSPRR